jgi:hypothetical protein
MSDDMLDAYDAGIMSAEQASKLAHEARGEILEASRARQTKLGRAYAESLKKTNRAYKDLISESSIKRFGKSFEELDPARQEVVFLDIAQSAGRARASETRLAARLKWGGRALVVLTLALSVFTVATSPNPEWAAGHELSTLGGGLAGGAAGGAAMGAMGGVWAGPVGIAIGAAVGGILGALIADEAYLGAIGPELVKTRPIIGKYAGFFNTDEEGLAQALYRNSGIDLDEVYLVFIELDRNYNSDSDDVAIVYFNLVWNGGGAIYQAMRRHKPLMNMLTKIFDEGWTSDDEAAAIYRLSLMAGTR